MENPRSSMSLKEPDRERTAIISGIITQEKKPEDMASLIKEYVKSDCDIITAPVIPFGQEDKANEIIALTKSNAKEKKVAGVLPPIADTQEPFGEIGFDSLVESYAKQADALFKADVDIFFIRCAISIPQARAAIFACRSYKLPIYLTVLLNEKGKLPSGASARCAIVTLQELDISAFGITASPKIICEELLAIRELSNLPIIAEITAGDKNPILPELYELSPLAIGELAKDVLDCGATILAGGEGITPTHQAELLNATKNYIASKKDPPQMFENDIFLANETDFFVLDNDRLEFSDHVHCELDMADTLLLASQQNAADVITVIVQTIEEAGLFADNAHFTNLPVCFVSDNPLALERALLLYNGKALIDSRSPLENAILKAIAIKYGAIVY